jgi:hypothetical protein
MKVKRTCVVELVVDEGEEEGCSSNLPTLSRGGGQFRLGMMIPA